MNLELKDKREFVVSVVLLVLWLAASFTSFKAAAYTLGRAPEILAMTETEKRVVVDGPVYLLAEVALKKITFSDTIYLYNADEEGYTADHYSAKLRYYLAPRDITITTAAGGFDIKEALARDYLISVVTTEKGPLAFDRMVMGSGVFDKVFYQATGKKHQMIYRRRGGGAR